MTDNRVALSQHVKQACVPCLTARRGTARRTSGLGALEILFIIEELTLGRWAQEREEEKAWKEGRPIYYQDPFTGEIREGT